MLTRLLKKQGITPKRMITDKLRSYGAARRQVMPNVEHRSHKGLNNRAENSHVPLRKRERMMQTFRSPGSLQRFVSVFSALEISSFHPVHNAPHSKTAFTASKRSRSGKLWRESWHESIRRAERLPRIEMN